MIRDTTIRSLWSEPEVLRAPSRFVRAISTVELFIHIFLVGWLMLEQRQARKSEEAYWNLQWINTPIQWESSTSITITPDVTGPSKKFVLMDEDGNEVLYVTQDGTMVYPENPESVMDRMGIL